MISLNGWSNYWFRESPYFNLAFLRIGAVGLQCYLLLANNFDGLLAVNNLPDELYYPRPVLQILMFPWGSMIRPDPEFLFVVYWIVLAFGAASFFGVLTNISLSVFAVGNLFMQAYQYSFGDAHHPSAIMMIFLLALAFSPCGKVLSVDAIVRGRYLRRRIPDGGSVGVLEFSGNNAYWPIGLMQWFFPLMYLSAVVAKVTRSGLDWANGFTLQYALIQDGIRYGNELSLWFSQFHGFIQVTEWVVLLFQATFFLIVFFPRLRWIYLPLGLCFHLGIYFTLAAPFPQWIFLYSVYIPWSRVFRQLADRRVLIRDPAVA